MEKREMERSVFSRSIVRNFISIVVVGIHITIDLGAIGRRVETPVVRRRCRSESGLLAAIQDCRRSSAGPLYHRLVLLIGQYVTVRFGRGGHVVGAGRVQMVAG